MALGEIGRDAAPDDMLGITRSTLENPRSPQMYRVYQAYDSVVKQDAQRTIQAALRNAFSQRAMKPTFKSTTRINKDAASKAKRVIKEVSATQVTVSPLLDRPLVFASAPPSSFMASIPA